MASPELYVALLKSSVIKKSKKPKQNTHIVLSFLQLKCIILDYSAVQALVHRSLTNPREKEIPVSTKNYLCAK